MAEVKTHCSTYSTWEKSRDTREPINRHNKQKDKLAISEIIHIFTSEDMETGHSSLGCGFVCILRQVYFPVKHSYLSRSASFSRTASTRFARRICFGACRYFSTYTPIGSLFTGKKKLCYIYYLSS